MDTYTKAKSVIMSCRTRKQCAVAEGYLRLAKKRLDKTQAMTLEIWLDGRRVRVANEGMI